MPDIFLSYTREDLATAQRFAEGFEAQGFSVWWDATLRSGEAYDQVTEEALRTARVVVVLWSKKSAVSRWVRAEATLADRNRTLAPARIEPCDLPIMFELTQTADLSQWKGDPGDAAWRGFVADVRRFVAVGGDPAPAAAPPPAKAPPPRGRRPSIAVLPFINRSGVAEDEVFAAGMVEDLTAALSVSRKMKVIAASATAAYRKGAADLRQIGRDLGVRYLLEGNVRRTGDGLRVTAQLVQAEDEDILWTQKFDRPLAELATLQEDLVTEVAAHLGVQVQRAEMELALRKPGDITAWEAVLRAEANLSLNSPRGAELAAGEAARAIEIDPDYDLGHATLAIAKAMMLTFRGGGDPELAQEVLAAVARACALESGDPIVLSRIAVALAMVGRPLEALPYAERSVTLNPNLEIPHIGFGTVLQRLGRWDEAVAEFEAAERLAPSGVWTHATLFARAVAQFKAGLVEASLELNNEVLRRRAYAPAVLHRAVCLALLGRRDEARAAMVALRASAPAMSFPLAEQLLRSTAYMGMATERVDEYVEVARGIWAEAASEPGAA